MVDQNNSEKNMASDNESPIVLSVKHVDRKSVV